MLQFRSVALSDKEELTEFFRRKNYPGDQYSFANLYIWRNIFHFAICVEDGVLFIRTGVKGSYTFLCPMGSGDLKQSVEKLLDWCREEGCSLRMEWVPPEDKAALEALFGSRAKVSSDRDHADYIYSREKLCTLAGKKLHAKRNFIHRFREQNWTNVGPCSGNGVGPTTAAPTKTAGTSAAQSSRRSGTTSTWALTADASGWTAGWWPSPWGSL